MAFVEYIEITEERYEELLESEKTLAAIAKLPDEWREDCSVSIYPVKFAIELKADQLQALLK